SQAAHGDPRVLRRLTVEDEDGPAVEWGPRLTQRYRTVLVGFALGARDMAVLLEEATGETFAELGALDELLQRAVRGWSPTRDWAPGTGRGRVRATSSGPRCKSPRQTHPAATCSLSLSLFSLSLSLSLSLDDSGSGWPQAAQEGPRPRRRISSEKRAY